MERLNGGLAAAVRAASQLKPNSSERRQQMLNFKLRCAPHRLARLGVDKSACCQDNPIQQARLLPKSSGGWVQRHGHPFVRTSSVVG